MKRAVAAAAVIVVLALAGIAAAQSNGTLLLPDARSNGLNDRTTNRTLPGDGSSGPSDRLPDRQLPQLQDRDGVGSAPPAVRDRFADYCQSRGGCPGGYAQHQSEFMAREQQDRLRQREELERKLQLDLQQGRLKQ